MATERQGRKLHVENARLVMKLRYRKLKRKKDSKHKDNKIPKNKKNRKERRPLNIAIIISKFVAGEPKKVIRTQIATVSRTTWFNIDIGKDIVEEALSSTNGVLRLHVRCKGCKKGARLILVRGSNKRKRKRVKSGSTRLMRVGKTSRRHRKRLSKSRPFLSLETLVQTSIRTKRSICDTNRPNSVCCKQSFLFNFAEQGWDDWVLSPRTFNAGLCAGQCSSDVSNHTCNPTRTRPLRIRYLLGDRLHTHLLPGMVIDRCGCF